MPTPADLVQAASRAGAQVKKMPSAGVRSKGTVSSDWMKRQTALPAPAAPAPVAANKRGQLQGDALAARMERMPAPPPAPSSGDAPEVTDFNRLSSGIADRFDQAARGPITPPPPPQMAQGREVNPDGTITGANGGVQQLGPAALARLKGFRPMGGPTDAVARPIPPAGLREPPMAAPDPADPRTREFIERLGGNMQPGDLPPADAAPSTAGLFDSIGRVGAGLPPGAPVAARPRPMLPYARPAKALGGF